MGIFGDLKPRELEVRFNPETGKREDKKMKKSKSRAVKNFGLLSFGDEAEEDEDKEEKNKSLVKNKSIYEEKKATSKQDNKENPDDAKKTLAKDQFPVFT